MLSLNFDAEIKEMNFASKTKKCGVCGKKCSRHSKRTRRIKDVSESKLYPVILSVTVGVYRCPNCKRFFRSDVSGLASNRRKYTNRVMEVIMRQLDGNSLMEAQTLVYDACGVKVPLSTLHDFKSAMEYALASGIEVDSKSMEWLSEYNKIRKINRIARHGIFESFDPLNIKKEKEKNIRYDFPGRKVIIPEGTLLMGKTIPRYWTKKIEAVG